MIFSLTNLLPFTYSSILAPFVIGYLGFPASFIEIKFDFSVRFSRMVASEFKLLRTISKSPSRSKSAYAAPLLYEGTPVSDVFTFSKFNFPLFLNKIFGILRVGILSISFFFSTSCLELLYSVKSTLLK